jgi:small multidrug resistance pump
MKRSWHTTVLKFAAVYNIVWGAIVILYPLAIFDLAQMQAPLYPEIWQCVGMIVGVYGVGYWLAAKDPYTHYPIVLVGLLGKILGPIGFAQALYLERFPLLFGVNIIFNDIIWWIPFGHILWTTWKVKS